MTCIVWLHVQENWIYMGRWQNTNHSSPPRSWSNAISSWMNSTSFLLSTVNYKLAVTSKAYAVIDTCVMQHLAIVFAACIRVMCSQGDVFGSGKMCFLVSLLLYEGHIRTVVTRVERKNVNLSRKHCVLDAVEWSFPKIVMEIQWIQIIW